MMHHVVSISKASSRRLLICILQLALFIFAQPDKRAVGQTGSSATNSSSPTSDFQNYVGTIDTSRLPKGATTITGANAEATSLAYQTGMAAADRIAGDVCGNLTGPLILFNNQADIDALRNLFIVRAQLLSAWRSAPAVYSTLQLTTIPATPGITNPIGVDGPSPNGSSLWHFSGEGTGRAVVPILSSADAALSLISLFKTDSTLNGVSLTTDDLSLQLMIAGQLRRNSKCSGKGPIFQTAYSVPPLRSPTGRPGDSSPLIDLVLDAVSQQSKLQTQSSLLSSMLATPLNALLAALQKLVGDSTADPLVKDQKTADQMKPGSGRDAAEATVKAKKAAIDAIPIVQGDLGLVQSQITIITNLVSQSSAITASLTSTGGTALQAALKAEALNCALAPAATCITMEAQPYVLITKMSAIGGDNATRQNIFRTTLSFSGEITATYLLLDNSGAVVTAGMTQCYGAVSQTKPISDDLLKTNKVTCRDYTNITAISQ
jgi:hypothetical protein